MGNQLSMKTENQKQEPGLLSEVKPVNCRKFRLTLLFALAAIISITITTTLVVNRVAAEMAESSVIRSAEENALRDAEYLVSDYQLANDNPLLTMQDLVSPQGLPSTFLTSVESLNIVKFTLVDVNGVAVWSTDPASIGNNDRNSALWPKAVSGNVVSKLDRNKTFVVLSGENQTTDIVETYLPLRSSGWGDIIGVMEVYSDVETQLAIGVDATKAKIRQTVFASMGGLFLILLGFIVVADLTIYRSNRRQMVLAEEAQQMLEGRIQQQIMNSERLEAVVAERQRAEEEQKRLAEERQIVADIGRIITSTLNIEEVYEKFALEVKKLVDFDRIVINLIDHQAKTYTLKYMSGLIRSDRSIGTTNPLVGSQTEHVVKSRQTWVREDIPEDLKFVSDPIQARTGFHSNIMVPLLSKGRVIGTLSLRSREVKACGSRAQEILERLANQIAPAVENAQLYERTKQAEESLRKLSRAVEQSPSIVLITDVDHHIEYVNPKFTQITGYAPEEVIGKTPRILQSGETPPEVYQQLWNTITSGKEWRGELLNRKKNGERYWSSASISSIKNSEGVITHFIAVEEDVTERKQAEERIQESGRLASVGELAAGVAHEINNPLTSVLGFTQLILQEDVPEQIRDDMEKIRSEAERAGKIVHNLLSFARKHEPEQQYLELTSILERALELKSFDLKNGNIQLKRELSPDLPQTLVDEHQLIQVIMNVITNAEQAMKESEGRGQLIVRTSHTADRIRLSISDDGPGMSQESLARIFEPFFTTKEVGMGTGLGLSICHGIIQQHGGDIWAESIPGEGTTFHIELPITSPPEEEREPSPTKHILVVDDEPHIRDLLARSLVRERYTVDLAENGEEAWRKVQSISYDCIVMDLKMPGMSGTKLFQHIKEYDQELAKKVIFITGDLVSPDTLEFVVTTGNLTLTKPFDLEELHLQISSALEARGELREQSYA